MTKKEKIEKCREILKRYNPGQFINNIEDAEFIDSILDNHKYRDQKVNGQPYEIFIDYAKGYNTKCFNLKREDGTTTDFSFYECIYPTKTDKADFVKAARKAVKNDILIFKENNITDRCIICGNQINNSNTHIDHYPIKFRDLISNFIKEYKLKKLSQYLTDPEDYDNVIGVNFTDKEMEELWIKYHKDNAKLRAICSNCNLKLH